MRSEKRSFEAILHQPFKDLKKLMQKRIKKTGIKRGPVPGIEEDTRLTDEELFRDAMKEVREIREFREIPVYQKKTSFSCKSKNTQSDQEALEALEEIVKGRSVINLSDTQEYIEWINQDYREDIIKKLHKGQYSVQDCLDLHGIIVEEAEKEVEIFLRGALRKGYRCIKIIHGRGLRSAKGPVMKQALISWLLRRYRKNIIAFVTARQCDGGLGALYVLLR
ncbi:MAG: Smr/MutS family protein [Nitrospirae bacterium]|nr:Smr/MutS family protein [Nitrospirota bacterium]